MNTYNLVMEAANAGYVTVIFYTPDGIRGQTYRAGHLTDQHNN